MFLSMDKMEIFRWPETGMAMGSRPLEFFAHPTTRGICAITIALVPPITVLFMERPAISRWPATGTAMASRPLAFSARRTRIGICAIPTVPEVLITFFLTVLAQTYLWPGRGKGTVSLRIPKRFRFKGPGWRGTSCPGHAEHRYHEPQRDCAGRQAQRELYILPKREKLPSLTKIILKKSVTQC